MSQAPHLTVGEIADIYGAPRWKVRRIVDSLRADLPRAGRYRLVPRELLMPIAVELQRRAHPRQPEEVAS